MPAGGLREDPSSGRVTALQRTILLYEACNRPIWLIAHRLGQAPGSLRRILGLAHTTPEIGVLSVLALALRPESSAQARMPPTARSAPRGERRGLLVLTAGPVRDSLSTGAIPPTHRRRSDPDECSGVLALFLLSDPIEGREDLNTMTRTELIAGVHPSNPKTPERKAAAREQHHKKSRPARSRTAPQQEQPRRRGQPRLRVHDETAPLERPTDAHSDEQTANTSVAEVLTYPSWTTASLHLGSPPYEAPGRIH